MGFLEIENAEPSQDERYIPLDDSEYPYAGVPRLVIETKDHKKIRDIVTEVPAILQVWGENKPISSVMDLIIKGRGFTSWNEMPKRSYKLEFVNKEEILGMPADRDWALLANYADKTLMKNYLMYHLSAKLGAYYSPRCDFVELYLNGDFLGTYLLTETIKIAKNRVDIPKTLDSYIVEFDGHLREGEQSVRSDVMTNNGKIYRIHKPKNATTDALLTVEKHIRAFEEFLIDIKNGKDNNIGQWLDVDECVKHYWVQEFSKNPDANFLSSVYFSWVLGDVMKMGPVWDFDLSFGGHVVDTKNLANGWYVRNFYWNVFLFKDSLMMASVERFWMENRPLFNDVIRMADSVALSLGPAVDNNFKRWNILASTEYRFHRKAFDSYIAAVDDLKNWIRKRIAWIDGQIEMAN